MEVWVWKREREREREKERGILGRNEAGQGGMWRRRVHEISTKIARIPDRNIRDLYLGVEVEDRGLRSEKGQI